MLFEKKGKVSTEKEKKAIAYQLHKGCGKNDWVDPINEITCQAMDEDGFVTRLEVAKRVIAVHVEHNGSYPIIMHLFKRRSKSTGLFGLPELMINKYRRYRDKKKPCHYYYCKISSLAVRFDTIPSILEGMREWFPVMLKDACEDLGIFDDTLSEQELIALIKQIADEEGPLKGRRKHAMTSVLNDIKDVPHVPVIEGIPKPMAKPAIPPPHLNVEDDS